MMGNDKGTPTSHTRRRLWLLVAAVVCMVFYVQVTHAEDTLNVFIIPHSHCDPGWLNTFEGYFNNEVHRILDGVIQKLLDDSTKKFVWAEISFFELWYNKQTHEYREAMKKIVDNGQLEFVAGGWVQNDEANANFDIVIDQVTEGHEFLLRTFGVVPRVAWQIDPFGHSSLTPALFSQMGFEAVVINRIHYNLKNTFKQNKQMEFLWQGSTSLGESSEIFTHVLHTHYSAPKGFDWEDGVMGVNSNNAGHRARELVNNLKDRSHAYRTNNLLVPFGDDFKFKNPGLQFGNMDQLIEYINSHKSEFNVHIQYSTVSQYFDAVFKTSNQKGTVFPRYEGDFFPYADNADAYWTGYYTTRPYLKGHSRRTDSHLKAAEGLYALGRTVAAQNPNDTSNVDWAYLFQNIMQARRDAALVQHHDGITGTAKQFVADDYAARLDTARVTAKNTIKQMMQVLLTDKATPDLYDRTLLKLDDEGAYAVVVHNPLGWTRRKYVSIQVSSESVSVTDHTGVIIPSQVLPVWDFNTRKKHPDQFLLYFMVEVQPLALRTYFISKATSPLTAALPSTVNIYSNDVGSGDSDVSALGSDFMSIDNEHLEVVFSKESGFISSITNKDENFQLPLKQELVDHVTEGKSSGAYIFRPARQVPTYEDKARRAVHLYKGSLVSQACIHIFTQGNTPDASICARVFSSKTVIDPQSILEVGGYVQMIYDIGSRPNHETVARYTTNLATDGKFYTDNGLEIRGRKRGDGGIQTNYYPNPGLCYLSTNDIQFSIMSRQAMGTSSLKDGQIEMMMHRNLRQDDGRGLGEPNNDGSRISVQVMLMVQKPDVSARIARRLALAHQHFPRVMLGTTTTRSAWVSQYKVGFEPMATQLPPNTHLVSLKARDAHSDDVVIRLAHIFASSQHAQLSKPAEVKWERLFKSWDVISKREKSLALTMNVEVAQKRRPSFAATTEMLPHQSGLPAVYVKGESQNTDEEGVFISQASLDDKKKVEEAAANKLQGRKLLALDDLLDPSLIINPLQIKSFLVHLTERKNYAQAVLPTRKPIAPQIDDTQQPTKNLQTQVINSNENNNINVITGVPDNSISVNEVKALLIVSVICTGLMVLAYTQLRRKAEKRKSGSGIGFTSNRVIV